MEPEQEADIHWDPCAYCGITGHKKVPNPLSGGGMMILCPAMPQDKLLMVSNLLPPSIPVDYSWFDQNDVIDC